MRGVHIVAYHINSCLYLVFAMCRENELLKHQLKKYVSAVQMLRRQGAQDDGNGSLLWRNVAELEK